MSRFHLLLVAAFLVSACSEVPITTTTGPPQRELASPQVVEILSPTVEFFAGGQTGAELASEVETGVAACMRERGWEYEPVLQESSGEALTVEEKETFIREYGYGYFSSPSVSDLTRSAIEANQSYWETLNEAQRRDYSTDLGDGDGNAGVAPEGRKPGSGSCRAMAEASTGLPVFDKDLMDRMRNLYVASRDSREVAAARAAYVGCMRLRGYEVDQPSDANDLAQREGGGLPEEEAFALEVEIATADFECQKATILPVDQSIETRIVDTLIGEFPEYEP